MNIDVITINSFTTVALRTADAFVIYQNVFSYADTYGVGASIQGGNFNQILEGDRVNTEITCPGATIALCLMFLKTNNL